MFDFLGFGRSKRGNGEIPGTLPVANGSKGDPQHMATRRELLRTVLRDTLQKHGIPIAWIGFESVLSTREADTDVYLTHLVVKEWNENLMRFAPALEQKLSQGLSRFDAGTHPAKYVFYWKFSSDCGCPETAMPEPEFWTTKPALTAASATPAAPKKFDLPTSDYDHRSSGFAPTQPGDMV